jgi:hypothetical protein
LIENSFIRIKDYETKWLERMERLEGEGISEILLKYNRAGKRNPERAQKG